jgi:hypothetical protein
VTTDPQYAATTVEYYVVVNGYELRPVPGGAYAGVFQDYRDDAWRNANCN